MAIRPLGERGRTSWRRPVSQLPPLVVVAAAVQCIVPVPALMTPNDCAGITPPPETAVKLIPDWLRRTACGLLLRDMTTGTTRFPAWVVLIVNWPE